MDERGQETGHSTAINVGAGGQVGDITVAGDVVGRDKITITEELTYDVSDLGYNPYLGLASYTYEKRAFYGGREPQVHDAVARLTAPGEEPVVLFITGASGSGKSSLAQAGLLPALEEAYTAQGRHVRWSVTRPGRHPIAALAQALGKLGFSAPPDGDWSALLRTPEDLNLVLATQTPPTQINVLILDQFEELFTQADPAERDATCGLLSGLDMFEHVRTQVIATLRADYLSSLFDAPKLLERYKQDGIELRAMSSEELARSIRRPIQEEARREGKDKRLDPALVERLIEDVGGDPSLLPLLQVTLRALWDEPPNRMVLARYQSLTSTLEQQANQLIDQDRQGHERAAAEREQLLGILLDLVDVSLDDDPKRDVRRAVPKQDVLQGHPERSGLIEELVNARLLTTWGEQRDQTSVEMIDIIHETLLRNWSRLRAAIAAQREALQQRERFRLALHEWIESSRSDRYLLQSVRLAEGRSLAERNDVALRDPDGRAFLEQSTHAEAEARTRELRQAQRRQRILATLAGVAMLFAIAALVGGYFALISQQRAEQQSQVAVQQSDIATTQKNLAQSEARARATAEIIANVQRDAAISLAKVAVSRQLAALAMDRLTDQPDFALLLSVQAYRTNATNEARSAQLSALKFSPSLVTFLHHTSSVNSVAFSTDGATLASASQDKTVRLWDVGSRQPLGQPLTGHTGAVNSVAFSPDGTTLASASFDKTVRLWDVASHHPLGSPLAGHTDSVNSVAFSTDGATLASASQDKTVRLWDVGSRQPLGQPLTGHTGAVNSVAFSRDGTTLASASQDRTVRLWDVRSRQPLGQPLTGHTGAVNSVAFSRDGTTLASASDDRTVRLWDVASRQPLGPSLTGHTGVVNSVAFSPDGTTLASASVDQTVRLWDMRLWDMKWWLERSCRTANRNMTQAEWTTVMSSAVPYQRTCPDLPPGDGAPRDAQ